MWISNVDRPGNRLIQISLVSTINYLASNRLRTWGHWLSVINRCHDMIDDNYRVWSGYTLEGNR